MFLVSVYCAVMIVTEFLEVASGQDDSDGS